MAMSVPTSLSVFCSQNYGHTEVNHCTDDNDGVFEYAGLLTVGVYHAIYDGFRDALDCILLINILLCIINCVCSVRL